MAPGSSLTTPVLGPDAAAAGGYGYRVTCAELTDAGASETEADAGVSETGAAGARIIDAGITDAELTALALAADPDQPLDPDAEPLTSLPGSGWSGLPAWYMPPVMMRAAPRWRAVVVVAIVAAFLLINALGLCIAYGQLGAA